MSALAPGNAPLTVIVGKSTSGRGDTGKTSNAIAPARAIATVSSVVATGKRLNEGVRRCSCTTPASSAPQGRFRLHSIGAKSDAPRLSKEM